MEWSRTSLAVVTYVDFDLGERAAGVRRADGLVGVEDPHAADAAARVVPLVDRHVVGLLQHEVGLCGHAKAGVGRGVLARA